MTDTNYDIASGAERAQDLAERLLGFFKMLDADPAEALTATVITSAIIARGLGVPKDEHNKVSADAAEGIYAVPVPEGLFN